MNNLNITPEKIKVRDFLTYKTPFLKSTIPPQSDENLTDQIDTTVKQLDMIIHRSFGDDLTKAAAANAKAQVIQLGAMMNERLNAESDDYNACMDTIEAMHDHLTAACNEVRRLLEGETQAEKNSEAQQADIRQAMQKITELEVSVAALKAYEKSHPPALKAENDRLTKELSKARADRKESSKANQTIQQALNRANKQVSDQRKKLADDEKIIAALTTQLKDEQQRTSALGAVILRSSGGEGATTHYTRSNSLQEVTCYICTYHFQSPILPHLEKNWNQAITEDIRYRILDTLKEECPKLYQRIKDGEKAPLSDLRLPVKAQNALIAAGYTRVASIARVLTPEITNIAGIGTQLKSVIINALITWESEWSEVNGLVEEYRLSKLSRLA